MDKLLQEISIEKEHIETTLDVLKEALVLPQKKVIELSGIASCLHHIYTGMENIIKRILKFQKIPLPDSSSSHKDLLDIAVQQSIISSKLSDQLDTYRGFRHFFVHVYGILLREEELQPLAVELPKVWKIFDQEVANFFETLQSDNQS